MKDLFEKIYLQNQQTTKAFNITKHTECVLVCSCCRVAVCVLHLLPTVPWVGVLLLSCGCLCAASLAHGAVGWCVIAVVWLSVCCISCPRCHGLVCYCCRVAVCVLHLLPTVPWVGMFLLSCVCLCAASLAHGAMGWCVIAVVRLSVCYISCPRCHGLVCYCCRVAVCVLHLLSTVPWVGVLLLSCGCLCAASLVHGAVGWCVLAVVWLSVCCISCPRCHGLVCSCCCVAVCVLHLLPTVPWVGVLLLSCGCLCAASLVHGAMGWCVIAVVWLSVCYISCSQCHGLVCSCCRVTVCMLHFLFTVPWVGVFLLSCGCLCAAFLDHGAMGWCVIAVVWLSVCCISCPRCRGLVCSCCRVAVRVLHFLTTVPWVGVFLLSCDCLYAASLVHGAMGWCVLAVVWLSVCCISCPRCHGLVCYCCRVAVCVLHFLTTVPWVGVFLLSCGCLCAASLAHGAMGWCVIAVVWLSVCCIS